MKKAILKPCAISRNAGDNAEFAVCAYENVARVKHDSANYMAASDLSIGERHISVKAARFSLMSGIYSNGRTTVAEILDIFMANTHSNEFVYVTKAFEAYYMNITEFAAFVMTFCTAQRESSKNGGAVKVRCKHETKAMLEYLEAAVA